MWFLELAAATSCDLKSGTETWIAVMKSRFPKTLYEGYFIPISDSIPAQIFDKCSYNTGKDWEKLSLLLLLFTISEANEAEMFPCQSQISSKILLLYVA